MDWYHAIMLAMGISFIFTTTKLLNLILEKLTQIYLLLSNVVESRRSGGAG